MGAVLVDYPHRVGGHCGSGALRDLLEWAGLGWGGAPSEGLVFALGGGLDFVYLRDGAVTPPVYLVGRGPDLELDLLHRLGAGAELRRTDDPVAGWQWVKGELDAGRPVMVWADIAELPYLRVRLRMSRHDIVIIGYDDDEQVAYVVDNDREHVQQVPYDALARARASTSFPLPTRHAGYVVDWPSALPDLKAAAADALSRSVEMMRSPHSTIVDLSTPGTVSGSGLTGLEVFADDLARWPEVFADAQLTEVYRGLAAYIEKAGTGGGFFRRLLAEGCGVIAEHTDDTATKAAADVAATCAQAWTALAAAAVALDTTSSTELAVGLVGLERDLNDALADAARSLAGESEISLAGRAAAE